MPPHPRFAAVNSRSSQVQKPRVSLTKEAAASIAAKTPEDRTVGSQLLPWRRPGQLQLHFFSAVLQYDKPQSQE